MAKQAQFKAQFKTVNAKSDSIHAGQKREDQTINYLAVESEDIKDMNSDQIAKIINSKIVDYAKRLLAENSDNWDYLPQESDLTFDAMFEDFSKPSARGNRILSKANLATYANEYGIYLKAKLNKSDASVNANKQVIEAKFAMLLSDPDALATVAQNLSEFTPETESLLPVHDALIELLTELMEVGTKDLKSLL